METVVDEKGRIVIPQRLRERMGLREGAKIKLAVEKGKIRVVKPISSAKFIREMEGCVKEGSPIPKIDPLKLKRLWGKA